MWYEYVIKEQNLFNFVDTNKGKSNQAAIQFYPVSIVNNINQPEKHC